MTGKSPLPLFRFPVGDINARTIAIANQAGYLPLRWTVDTLGWEGTAGHITAPVVASRVLGAARPGEMVLMHVGSNPDDHTTLDADALCPGQSAGCAPGATRLSPSMRSPAEPAPLLAGLALVSKQVRRMAVAATTFTIGAGPACADGACGTVSRSAGKGTPPIPSAGRPRFGRAFRWALHRSVVTGHG